MIGVEGGSDVSALPKRNDYECSGCGGAKAETQTWVFDFSARRNTGFYVMEGLAYWTRPIAKPAKVPTKVEIAAFADSCVMTMILGNSTSFRMMLRVNWKFSRIEVRFYLSLTVQVASVKKCSYP